MIFETNHLEKTNKQIEMRFCKRFGKHVRHIIISVDLCQMNELSLITIPYEMDLNIDVFGFGMLNRILDNLYSGVIITKDRGVLKLQTIVQQLMLHPDNLRAASRGSYVLSFSSGCGHGLLFLALPRNQSIT